MAEGTEYFGTEEIALRLGQVRERIRAACERAGRDPREVTLIAVSKTKPFEAVEAAWQAGAPDFGENYVQELTGKMRAWDEAHPVHPVRWHMIGHLQKNKVKYLIGRVALIHSVDSVALAEQIEREAARKDAVMNILLEVNVAAEETKFGLDTAGAADAARQILSLPHVRLLGLMTSAPYTEDPETNRPFFRSLFTYAQELKAQGLIAAESADFRLPVLSMGMSGDFETAIEEGATMVRVGTSIFGARDYTQKARQPGGETGAGPL